MFESKRGASDACRQMNRNTVNLATGLNNAL